MRLRIVIDCDNDAFQGNQTGEVARILREYADRLESTCEWDRPLYDINGSRVGEADTD